MACPARRVKRKAGERRVPRAIPLGGQERRAGRRPLTVSGGLPFEAMVSTSKLESLFI